MGRLGDPDWWWEYALDGVVGGVIGGLVTALAVWLTLRHERHIADLHEARSLVLPLQRHVMRLSTLTEKEPVDVPAVELELVALDESSVVIATLLAPRWPSAAERFFEDMLDVVHTWEASGATDRFSKTLTVLSQDVEDWYMNPKGMKKRVTTPPVETDPQS